MRFTRRDALKGIAAASVVPLFPAYAFAAPGDRGDVTTTNFDDGWLFLRGDAAGAHESAFDGSAWRKVDLPHDWSIEDLPTNMRAIICSSHPHQTELEDKKIGWLTCLDYVPTGH